MGPPGRGGGGIGARWRVPTGRRAYVLAGLFSLFLPGLGHVYMGRFARALIWLVGTLAIAIIIREESDLETRFLLLQGAVNVFAAIDICLLIRTQGPMPRRR